MTSRLDGPALAAAVGLAALSAALVREAASLQLAAVYGVGPGVALLATACLLALLALAHAATALRRAAPREPADARPLLLIAGGLAGLIALVALGAGFAPATAVLFAATARAFGRRAPLADLALGFCLGLLVHLAFARALSLSLPAGPIERLF